MKSATNVFVTESNVETYLSKIYECYDRRERDVLFQLLLEEESRMGKNREHVENGQRRLDGCKERVRQQRAVVADLGPEDQTRVREVFLLETFERSMQLMEDHQRILVEQYRQGRL